MTLNLAELVAHIDEQERKGFTHLSISTEHARELVRGYQPASGGYIFSAAHDTPDIAGLIRLWPFPHPQTEPK